MKDNVKVYNLYELKGGAKIDILYGTLNDVRTFIKNQWKYSDSKRFNIEEEFYCYVDDDVSLFEAVDNLGYGLVNLCEVRIEDFMD